MMAGSHVVVGLAAWVCAAPNFGLPVLEPLSLAMAAVGSLLPDLDHPRSWLGRRLPFLSRPVALLLGHRGVTHSAVAVLGGGLLLRWAAVSPAIVTPLVVAYWSHLAADLVTPAGLRLAWPARRTFAVPLCKSGSPVEPVLVALLVIWMASAILGVEWRRR